MTTETVIRRKKLSFRKKGILWLYWLAACLLMFAIFWTNSKAAMITGILAFGVGILLGLRLGRDKEWFSENDPRDTI